ncbi:hypothetical protein SAMN03159423_4832 [Bradyrhizobium sp. NFR13]|nr:hypothetical protein SAMN03159423_4832 [Bradyrhizobium sp. NFR13]
MESPGALFDWAEGARARDAGMIEASFAETLSGSDYPEALEAAIRHVAIHQCTVHIDDVLPLLKVKPLHPNSAGWVWTKLIADKVIVETNESLRSKDPKKRRHRYPVYASGLFSGRRA